ncbi:DUF4335 domain-containing protein [Lyngbya confervoides]|uniref:DUF4335 domain-containing protein n=1 Tax=Lyngbya confervoides BDU141951 TaxID=1574623 RepID=A0ABD4SYF3_9CYAN|nr:DUF4335 domain-containing protein [Lyngbya confervoides]MCM1981352.1 DUF4335 domain-containing protein [Lyngbya confervoides BDU141951]
MIRLSPAKTERFTNPHWSLAIAVHSSPLSRWWGQELGQIESFSLALLAQDESSAELPGETAAIGSVEDRLIEIQGDPDQLEALGLIAEAYVQQLLAPPVQDLSNDVGSEHLSQGASLLQMPPRTTADLPPALKLSPFQLPRLEATSWLRHRLYLGDLGSTPSQSSIVLTTLQLYDLAEILQLASQTLTGLPVRRTLRLLPDTALVWTRTAAMVAIALGLTGGMAWWIGGTSVLQTAEEGRDPSAQEVDQGTQPVPGSPPRQSVSPSSPLVATSPAADPSQGNRDSPSSSASKSSESPISAAPPANPARPSASAQPTQAQPHQFSPAPSRGADPPPQAGVTASANSQPTAPISKSRRPSQTSEADSPGSPPQSLPTAPTADFSVSAVPPSSKSTVDRASESARLSRADPQPQSVVSEIQKYFQARWQSQDTIQETLSFTLTLNADGTLQGIRPLNSAGERYQPQAPLPKSGEAMVSSSLSGPVQVTVNLYPDGSVNAVQP